MLKMEEQKKELLIKLIKECIDLSGDKDITMQHFADHCGVAKGTLYNYFTNKEDLLLAVIQEILDPFDQEVECTINENTKTPHEKLQGLVKIHTKFLISSKNLIKMYLKEVSHTHYDLKKHLTPREKFIQEHTQKFLKICSSLIKDIFPESNSDALAYMFNEMLKSHLVYSLHTQKNIDQEIDSSNLYNFFMFGASKCTF